MGNKINWPISFVLTLFGFLLIEKVFTISPDSTSGNGNLAILIALLFSPIFIASYFFTYKGVKILLKKKNVPKVNIMTFTIALTIGVLLIIPITSNINEIILELGGGPKEPNSKIFRFGWFNQYTNSIFFNIYTFLASHILIVIAAALTPLKKLNNTEQV